jgi:hypothetical protein
VHTQFGVTMAGVPVLERFRLNARVRTPSGEWTLTAINANAPGGLVLFTPWFDSSAITAGPGDSVTRVKLLKVGGRGDTARYRVHPSAKGDSADVTPEHIALLVASGASRPIVERLRAGERVDVITRLEPDRGPLRTLVGGWPRIVQAGRSVALDAASVEGTIPRFSRARHPRSALGISRDSSTLYLVTVDGRQQASVGMTLEELADAMIALGAYEAMNFDGGGSTALVIRDSVVNAPSDTSGERPVGNVVAVTRRAADHRDFERRAVPRTSAAVASCVMPVRRDTASAAVRKP